MNDNQLENLLQQEVLSVVADEGFSDTCISHLPAGSRRPSAWIKIAAISSGILVAALLPNGTSAIQQALS
ncbi:MAG: hypothetical protein K2P84_06095, partial [Undibacterium sp.]|nr:hypothetical protein [Undibacterium sp.]